MNPVTIGKATIYNMDCMELLKATPDKFYDLAIVDPPYGIGVNQMNMGGRKTVKPSEKNWDNSIPTQEYFNELSRCSKKMIIWGGNYFNLPPSQYFAIWDKGETMYGRDFAEMEYAWCSAGGTRILKLSPNQPERFHPTQKPIKLYEWLLTNYAKQGDKILDTHLGSGSHAIACNNLGFELTACELDKDYFEAACKRIEQASKQTSLFEPQQPVKPAQEALL